MKLWEVVKRTSAKVSGLLHTGVFQLVQIADNLRVTPKPR